MASFVLFDASTTARTLASGEFGFIGQLGSLATTGGAINATGDVSVTVLGSLFSASSPAIGLDGDALEFWVGGGANVGSAGSDTILARATLRAFVTNDGSSTSTEDAIDLRASDSGARIVVFNTGAISGASDGVVTNSGDERTTIVNRGAIFGESGGIDHLAGDLVLRNYGDISGEDYGFDGAEEIDTLRNFGRIDGPVRTKGGNDVVRNAGVLDGLDLGAGDDSFDGRGGDAGIVEGGDGFDELRGGANEDNLRGGGDDDLLIGRAGDDILRGDTGLDVLNGGRGDDSMRGGFGADTFRFRAGDGFDRIVDWGRSDFIDLQALGLRSFGADVRGAISEVSGGVVIDLEAKAGLVIYLDGIESSDLVAADFLI